MKKIKTILGVILLLIIIAACSSKKNVIQEKGICVTTDKTDNDPNIIISSGECKKDE